MNAMSVNQSFSLMRNFLTEDFLHFDDENKLGEGSFGIVFRGFFNKKPAAVKRIAIMHIASNKQEEEALKKLDHPNVIKLFQIKSDANFR
jgi:serine/threonine-protein kinase/endoribonuclease IRE1